MAEFTRRQFIKIGGGGLLGLYVGSQFGGFTQVAEAAIPGGTLDPVTGLPKFTTPLLIPPVMPKAATLWRPRFGNIDYYQISMKQFQQQILPSGLPMTTVWGYGAVRSASTKGLLIHNAPSLTIEATAGRPARIMWINDLRDTAGNYLPHLLSVDPTLHWANPPGGKMGRDTRPTFAETPGPYTGPVPIVTHVHGAVGVGDESDGYAEAWYLPNAKNIPAGYAKNGTWWEFFRKKALLKDGILLWGPGFATFQYPNDNRASTIWYHDHALGMTRTNVYAGPAGFYIVRGGPDGDGAVIDKRYGSKAKLPGPAPKEGDPFPSTKAYYEIPIAIQDRAFNADGSLFYPDSRAFFDGDTGPYIPDSDISPIWNPEFFGNTIMVNGNTWPYLNVEQRRYRFRFLNGCQARFLILDFASIPGVKVWQIGNEGGFLAAPFDVSTAGNRLLMGLAERADMIVDFTDVPLGSYVLGNVGPDEPFGGGEPVFLPPEEVGEGQFPVADPLSTGKIMQFRVGPVVSPDTSTPPQFLVLPPVTPLPAPVRTRPLALLEMMSMNPTVPGEERGPAAAMLGRVGPNGVAMHDEWMMAVTENPMAGDTEVWEFYNFTVDAHPMHVHEVVFEVVNREGFTLDPDTGGAVLDGNITLPTPSESGFKDTVIAYPGQVTRIRAQFKVSGQFVWHCHIVEHEDNEMMRPYRIGPLQKGQPPEGPMSPM